MDPALTQKPDKPNRRNHHACSRRTRQSVETSAVFSRGYVETRQPQGRARREDKRHHPARPPQLHEVTRVKRDHRRRHAKGDGVGNRVVFHAKLGDGIGHPGRATVEDVEDPGQENRPGGLYGVPGAGLDNGVEPGREVARRQDVGNQRSKALGRCSPARTAPPTPPLACGLHFRGVGTHSKTPFNRWVG